MNFYEALSGFTGAAAEVFFAGQFIAGTLLGSNNGSFDINVANSNYAVPSTITRVSIRNVGFVRIHT